MNILLKKERKILFNTLRTQRTGNLIGYIVAIAVLGIFIVFLSLSVLSLSGSITTSALESIVMYSLLAIVGFIMLLGVPQVFKDMYSTTDLELLFTLPIPTRNIFWVKYMKSYLGTPLLAFVFFVIPLVVYGIATGVSFLFYPVAILVLFSITIIGLSIAYLLNLLLIQIVPASRANEFITVMSILSGVFVYLLFMLPNMLNDEPLSEILLSGLPLLPKWVPISWGSSAIIEAVNGSLGLLLPLVLLLLLAVVSLLFTISLVEKGFRTGWIRLSEGSTKKKKKRKAGSTLTLHHPIVAVGKKEWFAIKRDLREWLVLLPIVFFFIFGLIGFLSGGGNLSMMRGHSEISWPVAQGIILFMFAFTSGTAAASSIGREGSSLWMLRVLPLSGKHIAIGKLWINWLLPFALLTVIEIIIGIFLGWTLVQFALGILMKAIVSIGLSALGLWFGTIGAKYNPKNPQQRLHFGISIILFVSSWIYIAIASIPYVYLLLPLAEIELPTELDPSMPGIIRIVASITLTILSWKISFPILMTLIGLFALAIVSFGFATIFILLSASRIDKGIRIDMVSEVSSKPRIGKNSNRGLY